MPATPESIARTRAFARVIGPFITLVAGALEVRPGEMGKFLSAFLQDDVMVWSMAAALVLGGLLVIALHQYWRSPAAVLISLFGWFVLLRGLVLLYTPQLMARVYGGAVTSGSALYVRLGFSIMLLIGLWLTWVGWLAKLAAPENRA